MICVFQNYSYHRVLWQSVTMSNINPDNIPTYDQAVYAANTAQEIQAERESGVIDRQYIRGIPGLLKAMEVVGTILKIQCF